MFGWKLIKEEHLSELLDDNEYQRKKAENLYGFLRIAECEVLKLRNQLPTRDKKTGRFIKRDRS